MKTNYQNSTRPRTPLVEGEDFYWEGSLMVLTREHHLKRGYCCNSECRHCPYRFLADGCQLFTGDKLPLTDI